MRVVANLSKTQFNANWVLLSLPKSTTGQDDAHNAGFTVRFLTLN